MSVNFKNVSAASDNKFVKPGITQVSIIDATFDNSGKSPFVDVVFKQTSSEANFKHRFFITEKALPRLQYLHTEWYGKPLEKEFDSIKQVGEYFEKVFKTDKSKSIKHFIIVGGKESDKGTVFADLPFAGFVTKETSERLFNENGAEYAQYVTKAAKSSAPSSNNTMIEDDDFGGTTSSSSSSEEDDSLPF